VVAVVVLVNDSTVVDILEGVFAITSILSTTTLLRGLPRLRTVLSALLGVCKMGYEK
jgi:hypothetical protein